MQPRRDKYGPYGGLLNDQTLTIVYITRNCRACMGGLAPVHRLCASTDCVSVCCIFPDTDCRIDLYICAAFLCHWSAYLRIASPPAHHVVLCLTTRSIIIVCHC